MFQNKFGDASIILLQDSSGSKQSHVAAVAQQCQFVFGRYGVDQIHVADGLKRMGEVVAVPLPEKVLRATICDAVFVDKENIRRE